MPETYLARVAVMSDYSGCDVLPEHESRIKQMIAGTAELYEPDTEPGNTYDLHSVVVPVKNSNIALRMTRLPKAATAAQVQSWIDGLREIAAHTADLLAADHEQTREK